MDLLDLIRSSTNAYTEVGTPVKLLAQQRWPIYDEFWKDGRNQEDTKGGVNHEWRIDYVNTADVKWVAPASVRNPTLGEFLVGAQVPLVNCYFEVVYTEHEEEVNRSGTAEQQAIQIVNLIKSRRENKAVRFFKGQEDVFWDLPVTTGANKTPYGLPYWIVPITAAQVTAGTTLSGDFQGMHADGFTDWCGIDLTTTNADGSYKYAGLHNWNATWDSTTAAFTMTIENKKRLGRMFRHLDFQAPMEAGQLSQPQFSKLKLLTDEYTIQALETAAAQQNDQLGNDALKYMGTGVRVKSNDAGVLVNGLPVTWVPALDTADLTNRGAHPFYMLNMECFKLIKRQGKFMKRRPPATDAVHQPDVAVEYIDSEMNYKMSNRRLGGGVISWVAAG